MNPRMLASVLLTAFLLLACQSNSSGLSLPAPAVLSSTVVSFNDVRVELEACEITPDRSAICTLRVANRFTNKRIEIDRRITIQDDHGSDYAVTDGGFGDNSSRPQWNQVAVADSDYRLTVIATNLSTRATAIRAVVFTRLLARSTQGQTLGYRDKVIFSGPRMIASGQAPPSASQRTTDASSPAPNAPPVPGTDGMDARTWAVVGLWNYDAADGQHLAQGYTWRPVPGVGLGQQWTGHLELRNHATLPPRARSLWPVRIHPAKRQICANYPGYPTYDVFVDLPGEASDGTYRVAKCAGQ